MARRKKLPFKRLLSNRSYGWIGLLGLVFGLVVMVSRVQEVQVWWSEAVGKEAHLVVPTQHAMGELRPVWSGVGQGLEGDERMLQPVEELGRELGLRYVRVDHILDNYDMVSVEQNGHLKFDFKRLDELVFSILRMNAKPVLVLSYMPVELSADGKVEGKPRDWGEWEAMVGAVVEHYSGNGREANGDPRLGLTGVYYEVWNEPDLFGEWKMGSGDKNYWELYEHTARAAERVEDANQFYLGGPATTGMYPSWIEGLVRAARENNWKLDFLSWHRYSSRVDDFVDDARWVRGWLRKEGIENLQLMVSEWGMSSDLDTGYDGKLSAAHGVAVVDGLAGEVDGLWPFEFKDGLDPNGKKFWGRWGMVTHEDEGLVKKPRFESWSMLGQLVPGKEEKEQRLLVLGEGSWVKAIGTKDETGKVKLIVSNYDVHGQHFEAVPIDFLGLEPGRYVWKIRVLDGSEQQGEVEVTTGIWRQVVPLQANEVILIELEKVGGGFGDILSYGEGENAAACRPAEFLHAWTEASRALLTEQDKSWVLTSGRLSS